MMSAGTLSQVSRINLSNSNCAGGVCRPAHAVWAQGVRSSHITFVKMVV